MGDGRRLGFRDALNRFVRTYSFVSQIAAFTGPALVPDFVSCRALSSYLPDTSTVERLDLGTEVELIRLRHQMTFTGSLSLSADVGEVRSFYGEGKGGRQGPGPGAPVQHHRGTQRRVRHRPTDVDEAAPGPVRGQLGRRRGACRSRAKQEHR